MSGNRSLSSANDITRAATTRVVNGLDFILSRINYSTQFPATSVSQLYAGKRNDLFDLFPKLKGKIPWYPLGIFPTPIEEWPSPVHGGGRFFVKRDDLTSPLFGGHKIRKIEHLLAEAVLVGAKTLIATGRIGSTQALAIALHGRDLGFKVDLSLFDQPVTEYVKSNLLGVIKAGAQIRHAHSLMRCLLHARRMYQERRREGMRPHFIASGATTTLGNIGYVNAGVELAHQLKDAQIPEPHTLFIPAGSCGTAAGLIIGFKLVNLSTRVMAVQTFRPAVPSHILIRAYGEAIVRYLRELDASVPMISITSDDLHVVTGYFGGGYGVPTQASREAVAWASPHLTLETTYTGKTLAACLDYCRAEGQGERILFWNTFNSAPFGIATRFEAVQQSVRDLLAS